MFLNNWFKPKKNDLYFKIVTFDDLLKHPIWFSFAMRNGSVKLYEPSENYRFVMAFEGEKPVGTFFMVFTHHGKKYDFVKWYGLFINPYFRSKGIAGKLIQLAKEYGRNEGFQYAVFTTQGEGAEKIKLFENINAIPLNSNTCLAQIKEEIESYFPNQVCAYKVDF
jgi:GNAT superfamily N-acetyltransferase